ncbi:oxygenase MpaB family protein [Arthrobacter halodurans]|uniref:Oxygenase MpaB family protein n=1 Tax=Arthrobacter halodurans TaxID=516699 RepID=A0ABV4UJ38_9MICC
MRGIADVAPEAVLLAGAGRALLLQLALPPVGRGVVRHSDFAADPLKRLHGTLRYIYALTNGTPAQAAAARAWVERAHEPVHGTARDGGPAYDAHDPRLQLWVAATLYDSATLVREAVLPPLGEDEAERLYRDYALLATALRMPPDLWPPTREDFARYRDGVIAELSVDDEVARAGRDLLAARNAPRWVRAAMPLARLLTAGFLPGRLRGPFGLAWSPRRERAFRAALAVVRVVYPRLPRAVRHAPMRHYLRAA